MLLHLKVYWTSRCKRLFKDLKNDRKAIFDHFEPFLAILIIKYLYLRLFSLKKKKLSLLSCHPILLQFGVYYPSFFLCFDNWSFCMGFLNWFWWMVDVGVTLQGWRQCLYLYLIVINLIKTINKIIQEKEIPVWV